MTTELDASTTRSGVGLGVTSLVVSIVAAVLAFSTRHPQSPDSAWYAYFFSGLGLAFGVASIFQSARPRSSAVAGAILSICSAIFVIANAVTAESGTTALVPTSIGSEQKASPPIPESGWAPSFDCEKVKSGSERLICSTKELSGLDVELGQAYSRAIQRTEDRERLKKEQTDWLKNIRNSCSDTGCMAHVYRVRIDELSAR